MKNNKNMITYTKEDIIKILSEETTFSKSVVKVILEELEFQIYNILSSANNVNDVMIKMFNGIYITGKFKPTIEQVNNITGETILTKEKIKPKVKFSRSYCENLYDGEYKEDFD